MSFFFFLLFFMFSGFLQAQVIERMKIQVGAEIISQIDGERFSDQLRLRLLSPSLLLEHFYDRSQILNDKRKRLDFMANRKLLAQVAEKSLLTEISKDNVLKKLKTLKGALSNKKFSSKLKKAGLTLEELKQGILTDLKIDELLRQNVFSKISVSKQEVEAYHFKKYHRAIFKSFEYEFVSVKFLENKKEQVLKNLRAGHLIDLKQLARLLDLEFKQMKLKDTEIGAVFLKELEKLSVSQISPVLILNGVYYILQLQWKTPQINPKEMKVKSQIERKIYEQKLSKEIKKWIEEKKSSFFIKKYFL